MPQAQESQKVGLIWRQLEWPRWACVNNGRGARWNCQGWKAVEILLKRTFQYHYISNQAVMSELNQFTQSNRHSNGINIPPSFVRPVSLERVRRLSVTKQ